MPGIGRRSRARAYSTGSREPGRWSQTGERDEVLEDLSWRGTWALLGMQWGATEFKVVVMAGSVCYTGYLLKHGRRLDF